MDKFLAVPSTSGMAQQPQRSRSRSPSPNCPHRPKDKFFTIFQTFKNAFQDGMNLQKLGEKTLKYNNSEINVDCISTSPEASLEFIKKQKKPGTCVILFGRSGAGKTSALVEYGRFRGMIREYYADCPNATLEVRALELKNKMCRDLVRANDPGTKIERLDWKSLTVGQMSDIKKIMKARSTTKTGLNQSSSRTIVYIEITNLQTRDRVYFVDMPGSEGVHAADAPTLTPAERSRVSSTRRGFVNDLSSFKHYIIDHNIPLSGTPFLNELRRRIYGDGTNVSNSNMFLVVCAQSPLNEANTMEVGNFLRDIQLKRDRNFQRGSRSPSPLVNVREPSRASLLRTNTELQAEIQRLRLENERLRRRRSDREEEQDQDVAAIQVEEEAEVAAEVAVAAGVTGLEDEAEVAEEPKNDKQNEGEAEAEVATAVEVAVVADVAGVEDEEEVVEQQVDDEEVEDDNEENEDEEDSEDDYSKLGIPWLLRPEFSFRSTWYAVDQPAKYTNIDWNNTITQVGSTVEYKCNICKKHYQKYYIRAHVWFKELKGKVLCKKCNRPYANADYIHLHHGPKCNGQGPKPGGRPRKRKN